MSIYNTSLENFKSRDESGRSRDNTPNVEMATPLEVRISSARLMAVNEAEGETHEDGHVLFC